MYECWLLMILFLFFKCVSAVIIWWLWIWNSDKWLWWLKWTEKMKWLIFLVYYKLLSSSSLGLISIKGHTWLDTSLRAKTIQTTTTNILSRVKWKVFLCDFIFETFEILLKDGKQIWNEKLSAWWFIFNEDNRIINYLSFI